MHQAVVWAKAVVTAGQTLVAWEGHRAAESPKAGQEVAVRPDDDQPVRTPAGVLPSHLQGHGRGRHSCRVRRRHMCACDRRASSHMHDEAPRHMEHARQ